MTHRHTPAWGLLAVFGFVSALVLAGCVGPSPGPGPDDDPESPEVQELFFEPGLGPGHAEALINLTMDAEEDAAAVLAACADATDRIECGNEHLLSILDAEGSMYAFDVLAAIAAMNAEIDRMDHPMAHVLGRHALYVYGTIGETLVTCSHKVFQGCIHGALQEYFEHVDLDDADLEAVCPPDLTHFEAYACNHGLGHGIVLATNYDLPRSLDLCATLSANNDRINCYGGAFMENVVAHNDHIRAGGTFAGHGRDPQTQGDNDDPHAHHGHDHGHDHGDHHAHGGETLPDFWVDPDDYQFPCNAIDEEYQPYCWRMQTSLILQLNGNRFQEVADVCAQLEGNSQERCYGSMGRDASAAAQRDPHGVAQRCGFIHDDELRSLCIRGAVGELVTNYADPFQGLPFCAAYPEDGRLTCYEALGSHARNHLDEEGLRELCDEVEGDHREECRSGARLE